MFTQSTVKHKAKDTRVREKPTVKVVTPAFTAAGNQPTVKVDGNKDLGEALVFAIMEPGKNTMESITLHRPIGLTPYSQGENWVGSYTASIPTLLAEGSNDLQKAEILLAQMVNELLVEKELIVIEPVNGKKTITYSDSVFQDSLRELEDTVQSGNTEREVPPSVTTDDFMTCNRTLKTYMDQCEQDKILPARNEVKKICDTHIDLLFKASDEYIEYRETLDAYNAASAKDRKRMAQPKAPRKRAKWTDYIPPSMAEAEESRGEITRETRSTFITDSINDGTLNETVDPHSRNKQLKITQFNNLSLAEVKNRLLGALHFGETLSGTPPEQILNENSTQEAP